MRELSRERKRQIRQKEKGLCSKCGNAVSTYPDLCDPCTESERERKRRKKNYKIWTPGSKGRIPKWTKNIPNIP